MARVAFKDSKSRASGSCVETRVQTDLRYLVVPVPLLVYAARLCLAQCNVFMYVLSDR